MKILIIDLTHGGDKIGREYLALGHDVTLVDIYHSTPEDLRRSLEQEGFRVLEAAPSEMFDLAVVPVHSPDRSLGQAHFARRITHHHAVGELVKFAVPVVEVTGAKAKTTTCSCWRTCYLSWARRFFYIRARRLHRLLARNGDDRQQVQHRTRLADPTVPHGWL